MEDWFGGIEAGGTKFNCIVARGPNEIIAELRIPTSTPEKTIPQVVQFFHQVQESNHIQIKRLGLGFFGPLDLDQNSPTYGYVTSTPKLAWRNTPVLNLLQGDLGIPAILDTDVNAAALGEGLWGAARGLKDYVYITIGTGIGGGVVCNGLPLHGLVHPEVGHVLLPHDMIKDPFPGICPYHKDCWEGLASGPALQARWKIPSQDLGIDHPAWILEAEYIAKALHGLILTLSPQKIILGGGVMKQPGLIEKIRLQTVQFLGEYVDSPVLRQGINEYIVPPTLGDQAGMLGCIALALQEG